DNAPETDLTINLSNGQSITIVAGQTSGTVDFTTVEDSIPEEDEILNVNVSSTSGGNYEDLDISGATTSTTVVDDDVASATVSVDSVTADDVINATEAGGTVTVTGTTSGTLVEGDTISFDVNGTPYSTTVLSDGTWSVDVAGSDLAADTAFTVTADGTVSGTSAVTTDSTHMVLSVTDTSVDEGGLATVEDTSETVSGTFTVGAGEGISSVSIAGQSFTETELTATSGTPVVITAPDYGEITITGYDNITGIVSYEYSVTASQDHTLGDVSDSITISITDSLSNVTSDTLDINIVDDVPIAVNRTAVVGNEATSIAGELNVTSGDDIVDITFDAQTMPSLFAAGQEVVFDLDEALDTYVGTINGGTTEVVRMEVDISQNPPAFSYTSSSELIGEVSNATGIAEVTGGNSPLVTLIFEDSVTANQIMTAEVTAKDDLGNPLTVSTTATTIGKNIGADENILVNYGEDQVKSAEFTIDPKFSGDTMQYTVTGTDIGGNIVTTVVDVISTSKDPITVNIEPTNGMLYIDTIEFDQTVGITASLIVGPTSNIDYVNDINLEMDYTVTDVDGDTSSATMIVNIDSDNSDVVLQGTFIDGAVRGLHYETESGIIGTTGKDGEFSYLEGESITFSVGGVIVGTFDADDIAENGFVFLQDVAGVDRANLDDDAVVNMAIFLQSIDTNHNPYDGISIPPSIHKALEDQNIDLATATEEDVLNLIDIVHKNPVTEEEAMTHVYDMLVDYDAFTGEESAVVTDTMVTTSDHLLNASDDTITTQEDAVLIIEPSDLLENDINETDFNRAISSVDNAEHGTVEIDASGQIVFTPDANYNGEASFSYVTIDEGGGTDTATVNLTITTVNDLPVIDALSTQSLSEDGTLSGQITATDADGDTLTFSIADGADVPDGLVVNADGTYTFDASSYDSLDAGEVQNISVPISVSDGEGGIVQTILNIDLNGINNDLTYVSETAGFNNVVGYYEIDGDGNSVNGTVVIDDQNGMDGGTHLTDLDPGNYEFFIIANGANEVDSNTVVSFDEDGKLLLDGESASHPVYYTESDKNPDGEDHFVFTSDGNGGTTISIEDLPNLGDADFGDVVLHTNFEMENHVPISADLADASDTGVSNTDDLTADNTPTITGNTEAGAAVVITDAGGNIIGEGVADDHGDYNITTTELADGTQDLTVTATGGMGEVVTTTQTVTIDTAATITVDTEFIEGVTIELSNTGEGNLNSPGDSATFTLVEPNSTVDVDINSYKTGDDEAEVTITYTDGTTDTIDLDTFIDGSLNNEPTTVSISIDGKVISEVSITHTGDNSDAFKVSGASIESPNSLEIEGAVTNVEVGQTVDITITDSEGGTLTTTAEVQTDGTYSVSADVSSLADGDLNSNVTVTDIAGNIATDSEGEVIDVNTAPIAVDDA
ncbi:MAG: Ig-like domain-containing protein, partial [Arcobacteraceae bacterium]|nr:Ig-like domain-containing protein [Arcobacteraceae bacterium]